ncbi:MAG: HAMP domain-containing histidine kinase [Xanthomonadaceae bacterium]|nr:HAMP domain-containing histidine kinase [Xanthomonadaceae bacterium]
MKRLLPSTSVRLALIVMGFFLAAFVLIGAGVYVAVNTLLMHDTRELVRSDAVTLVDIYREGGRAALLGELQDRIHDADSDPDAVYALADGQGGDLLGQLPDARKPGPRGRWVEFSELAPEPGQTLRVLAYMQTLRSGEILLTGQRLQAQDELLSVMQQAALMTLLIATALGALVGWLISHWVARRLRSLEATVARVGSGELALRAPLDHSGDAFDQVAQRFNAMLDRIEELLDGVRHATDHIAHDLRTPLTRLRNRLEDLHQHESDAAARLRLERALAETDQLLQSFGALLRLARIEAQPLDDSARPQPLRALVDDVVELYAPIAAERGIRIDTRLEDVAVRGDRDQLFQLVVNLLDNALKYAPAHSTVTITLAQAAEGVCLQLADLGPGIPESERTRVFDRFQRLEAHRGSPGVGLGLSLVQAIVRHHGGRVELHDNAPGLRVRVMLPLPG